MRLSELRAATWMLRISNPVFRIASTLVDASRCRRGGLARHARMQALALLRQDFVQPLSSRLDARLELGVGILPQLDELGVVFGRFF